MLSFEMSKSAALPTLLIAADTALVAAVFSQVTSVHVTFQRVRTSKCGVAVCALEFAACR